MIEWTDRCISYEYRNSDGTGGDLENTIVLDVTKSDQIRFSMIFCCFSNARDQVFDSDKRASRMRLNYV